jgi:hypothetical protein
MKDNVVTYSCSVVPYLHIPVHGNCTAHIFLSTPSAAYEGNMKRDYEHTDI